MDYPFKNIEHHIYKNTFLQNTLVEMQYESIKSRLSTKDVFRDFQSFASEFLGIKVEEDEGLTEGGVVISSKEAATDFYITDKQLIIKVGRTNYKTFQESVIPYTEIAEEFIKSVARLEEIKFLGIRKINIWPYSNTSNKRTLTEALMGKIFSKDLLAGGNFKSQAPENQNITQWMKEKTFDWEDIYLKIQYGFVAKDEQQERIILDSTAEISRLIKIDSSQAKEVYKKLNAMLFDAYHWSITNEIIQMMNKGDE